MQSSHTISKLNEADRLTSLKNYDILDTPPDGSFDRVTRLAAKLFKVPISIVTLVDSDRIWFKSRYGINVPQIDRDPGLCASAILSDEIYLVEDAQVDPRTLANPLVAGVFGLKFYAAAPLKTPDGFNLGTLCIIDKNPRQLNDFEKELLQELADTVMDQMILRLAARKAINQQNQVLSIAAHDLKNPLTSIPITADFIKKRIGDPEAVNRLCDQIKSASVKMTAKIDEILDQASVDAGKFNLRLKKVNLADVAKHVIIANQALAENKLQRLLLIIEDEPFITADENRIGEIIDNLINNAIKYSPKQKDITIKVINRDNRAILEVYDNGPGLTELDLQQMFQRFSPLSAVPTGGERATGLGLSIVKTLVEAHKGSIQAKSLGIGVGAVFILEIPIG
jgi:signal transduction histidine kinase